MSTLNPIFQGQLQIQNAFGTAFFSAANNGTVYFNGPMTQGLGSFVVDIMGNLVARTLVTDNNLAVGDNTVLGSSTTSDATSALQVVGARTITYNAAGVHAGIDSNNITGITLVSKMAGYGTTLDFMMLNAATWSGRIFYSHFGGLMQFWAVGAKMMVLNNTGLLVGPPLDTSTPDSCIVAAGGASSNVSTPGIHMGQLPDGAGTLIKLASPSTGDYPCIIDFNVTGNNVRARGSLSYLLAVDTFIFRAAATQIMSLSSKGVVVGAASLQTAESCLQAVGAKASTMPANAGVHMGICTGANVGQTAISIAASSSSLGSYIDFCYAGQTNPAYGGRILYSNATLALQFHQGGVESMRLNPSACLCIGTQTASATYKLNVNGSSYATVVAGGTKPFDIPHQSRPGWRLRFRAIESPQASIRIPFTLDCLPGENSVALPDYFGWPGTSPMIFVTPRKCFGMGWGDVQGQTLTVTVSLAGTYNILLWATRADDMAVAEFAAFGVEYQDTDLTVNAGSDPPQSE